MQLPIFLITAATVAIYLTSKRLLQRSHDPREPPLIPQTIPYVSHVLGMIKEKVHYYVTLRNRYGYPFYTLVMPGGHKIYVASSIEIVNAIQRQPNILSFRPVEAKFAMIVCNSSKKANDILIVNTNGEQGDWGYSMEFHKSLHPSLAPGAGLDAMNCIMIQNIVSSLAKLQPVNGKPAQISLLAWIRHELTIATTESVYGPLNPFKDPKVEEAFWAFEKDLPVILLNIFPSVLCSKGYRGRKFVGDAFLEYFEKKGHENGSVLVKTRHDTSAKNGIPIEDIARYEVGGGLAILANTPLALFWTIFYIYSNPGALRDCRTEAETVVSLSTGPHGNLIRSLDITSAKSKCPIITSTFQEVLRHCSMGISVRQVMQDFVLNEKYLLKKGSTVLLPTILPHTDSSIWGSNVSTFDHRRFIKGDASSKAKSGLQSNPSPSSFRGFGGGSTLCPGRHFATTEIFAAAIMFLMRYDLEPVNNDWTIPTTKKTNPVVAIKVPDSDIEVKVIPRKGYETGDWAFSLPDSEMVFGLVAEVISSGN